MAIVERLIQKKTVKTNFTIEKSENVLKALNLMKKANISALMVTDGDKIVGIFTERDYTRKGEVMGLDAKCTEVSVLMTADLITVTQNSSLDDCMGLMRKYKIRHLPVIEDGKMVGMVSMRDVVETLLSDQESMITGLENYIIGSGFAY